MKPSIVAIDGPAASGKSTLGHLLARRLGYLFFDTGVLYRAVSLAALEHGVSIDDDVSLTELARRSQIDVAESSVDDGRQYTVWLEGRDVTWELRTPAVDAIVSPVSAVPGVRRALIEQQRRIAQRGQIVMVGRDIGTVVCPDADLKLFIEASLEVRARRRYAELVRRGEPVGYEQVLDEMRRRDERDRNKPISPLAPAPDAIILDTTALDIETVVERTEQIIKQRNEVTAR
ncbi:MAG TPA: (d)CMP kinase [Anaerolineae bacterium]|nr:(d)CMP kinase [Anaerolineae bacterium]